MKKKNKKEPASGDVIEIPLNDGCVGYARVLKNPLLAFYKLRSRAPLDCTEVVKAIIAFKIWVMNSAITSGRWKVIGNVPLSQELQDAPTFFKEDPISKKLSLYENGIERSASYEECVGLERAAVWSAEHAECRLEDDINGKPNKWVDALMLK